MPGPLICSIWTVPDSITQLDGPHAGAMDAGHLPRGAAHLPCSQRKGEWAPGGCALSPLFGVLPLTHPGCQLPRRSLAWESRGGRPLGLPRWGLVGGGAWCAGSWAGITHPDRTPCQQRLGSQGCPSHSRAGDRQRLSTQAREPGGQGQPCSSVPSPQSSCPSRRRARGRQRPELQDTCPSPKPGAAQPGVGQAGRLRSQRKAPEKSLMPVKLRIPCLHLVAAGNGSSHLGHGPRTHVRTDLSLRHCPPQAKTLTLLI